MSKKTKSRRNTVNSEGEHRDSINADGSLNYSIYFSGPNCFIKYIIPRPNVISILTFQCDSNMDPQIAKGDGRKLMHNFLKYYLRKNNISPDENVEIVLSAVSNVNQKKLDQYYQDIGFVMQGRPTDRGTEFSGDIHEVIHWSDSNNYPRLKRTNKKTRRTTAGKTRHHKKRKNAKRSNRRL